MQPAQANDKTQAYLPRNYTYQPTGPQEQLPPDAPTSSLSYGRRVFKTDNIPTPTEFDPLSKLNDFRSRQGNPDVVIMEGPRIVDGASSGKTGGQYRQEPNPDRGNRTILQNFMRRARPEDLNGLPPVPQPYFDTNQQNNSNVQAQQRPQNRPGAPNWMESDEYIEVSIDSQLPQGAALSNFTTYPGGNNPIR